MNGHAAPPAPTKRNEQDDTFYTHAESSAVKRFKQLLGGKSLEESIEKSRGGAFSALRELFRPGVRLDEDFWEELEATLIMADVGPYPC